MRSRASASNWDAAIESYSKAIELEPSAVHYRQRGIVHREMEDYGSAISDLSRAIELMPNDKTSFYQRSLCYKAQGMDAKAKEDWDKSWLP